MIDVNRFHGLQQIRSATAPLGIEHHGANITPIYVNQEDVGVSFPGNAPTHFSLRGFDGRKLGLEVKLD